MHTIRTIFKKIFRKLFPSQQQIEAKRFFLAGGNDLLMNNLDLNENSIAFDLGGYKGHWSSEIYSRFNCNVYLFEPLLSFHEQLELKFKSNQKIKCFDFALGSSNRIETIFENGDGSSIFLKEKGVCSQIYFRDFKDFIKDQKIEIIDLMKINIEGGEYELLERLIETDEIKKIKRLQIQFHRIASNSEIEMKRIKNELSKTHKKNFEYTFVWEDWSIQEK